MVQEGGGEEWPLGGWRGRKEQGLRLCTWVGNLARLECGGSVFSLHSAVLSVGASGPNGAQRPGDRQPGTSPHSQAEVAAFLSPVHVCLAPLLPDAWLSSFCPTSISPQGGTVRLVSPCCVDFCSSLADSCPSVNLPVIGLPIALMAADSLAPGLHFLMSE